MFEFGLTNYYIFQQHDASDYEELNEFHQCPLCDRTFLISKLLFEHILTKHSQHRFKISQLISVLEENETVYSSDSDCDYEVNIEITKKAATRKEFEGNLLAMEYQKEPLKVVDGRPSLILKDNINELDNISTQQDGDTRAQCPKCVRTFSGRKNLRQHIKIYHVEEAGHIDYDVSNNGNFVCPECSRELSNSRNLRKHVKLCHNLVIRFVGVENNGDKVMGGSKGADYFDTPQVVQNDTSKDFPILRSKDDDTGRVIFKCGLCDYGPFFFARAIKRHQVKEHGREPLKMDNKDQIFRCEDCSKEFWSKDNLHRHLKLHSDDKNYVCNLCGDAFKTSSVLRKHRLAHVHIRCLICNDQFTLRSDYKSHHKAEHNHEPKSFEILDSELDPPNKRMPHIPSKVEQPTECERCHRVFFAMCGYKVHKCIEDEEVDSDSVKKRGVETTCEMCGRKYKSQKSFREHNCPNRNYNSVSDGIICEIEEG